ncbi:hypothetical protein EVA_07957 [gut metagenome]|uniref:Uncharacterized protein n=1 Tax=gut metagenome TaxID=749906 RepID=J9GAR3_9ZZZZ
MCYFAAKIKNFQHVFLCKIECLGMMFSEHQTEHPNY